ncbi:MAG: hypothetical protein VYD05_10015, partial [Planctomycetota bacterium]|nr:hypothetical protein [Planctomycetota bacterium]
MKPLRIPKTDGLDLHLGSSAPESLALAWTAPKLLAPMHTTALESVHVAAGARMVPFAGWNMPV